MHPCRWVVYSCAVVVLILMVSGLPGAASAQASDEDKVSFVWAFEALVVEGNVTKQVPIKEDIKLKTGDQLKMFVELRKPCFVYVIHHGARGEIQRLFPYDMQQFTTDYQTSKIYEIPPNNGWFRINEQAGLETFYLVASAQRLTDLETTACYLRRCPTSRATPGGHEYPGRTAQPAQAASCVSETWTPGAHCR